MRFKLRDYQQDAVDAVRVAMKNGSRRTLLVSPTGSGKTVCFAYITESAACKGNRVWILVHRQELVDQTSRTLSEIGVDHGIIAAWHGIDLTRQVQIASIQTLARRLDVISSYPDMIICDEAHHCPSDSWMKILDKFSKSRVLGVTATPERLDGKGLGIIFDKLVRGPRTSELIERGFLSRPLYFAPPSSLDMSGVKIRAGDYDKKGMESAVNRPTIVGDAVAHYMKYCFGAPDLAFCASLHHAANVVEAFRDAGFASEIIDGTMQDFQRRDKLSRLGLGTLNILASVDLIGEGIDVPIVTALSGQRPTASLVLHRQHLGRTLRAVYAAGIPLDTEAHRLEAIAAGPKPHAIILDHVGNLSRHGFAEDECEWSLEGGAEAKRKAKDGEPGDRIMQCPKCYAVHAPAKQCPVCGFQYVPKGREIAQVAGELVQIGAAVGQSLSGKAFVSCPACGRSHVEGLDQCPHCGHDYESAKKREEHREVGMAKTLDDLIKVGIKRGYKPWNAKIWAGHIMDARQSKKEKQNVA
jgi:DNA repair protein RadD